MASKVKLPSLRDPGYVTKLAEPTLTHGDITLWTLVEQADDDGVPDNGAGVWLLLGDLLVPVGNLGLGKAKMLIEAGRFPDSVAVLLDEIRRAYLDGSMLPHALVWEALGLSADARQERVDAQARERAEREREAEERHRAFRSAEEKRELDELASHLAALRVGGQVPGWRVLELARAYGMAVPPQTAGVLKRATWISEEGAQFPSKPSKSQAIWDVYRFAREHAR